MGFVPQIFSILLALLSLVGVGFEPDGSGQLTLNRQPLTMKILVLISVALFFSSSVLAKNFVGSSSASLGGAGSAVFEAIDSLYLNPSLVGSDGKIYVGSGFSAGSFTKDVNRRTYSLVSTDGSPKNVVPGGLGFKYHQISFDGQEVEEKEYTGAVSYGFWDIFRVGVAYSHIQGDGSADIRYRTHSGDVGLFLGPTPNIGVSLVAQNLVTFDSSVPELLKRLDRLRLGFAASVRGIIKFRWDMAYPIWEPPSEFRLAHSGGLSILLRGSFAMNGGVILDDLQEQRWWTAGLVWSGPRLKLGYSYQTEVKQNIDQRHLIDLWLDL